MQYLSELEERLASDDSTTLRNDTLLKLAAMEMRLQRMMSTQLMPPDQFQTARALASAAQLGQHAVRNPADSPQ